MTPIYTLYLYMPKLRFHQQKQYHFLHKRLRLDASSMFPNSRYIYLSDCCRVLSGEILLISNHF